MHVLAATFGVISMAKIGAAMLSYQPRLYSLCYRYEYDMNKKKKCLYNNTVLQKTTISKYSEEQTKPFVNKESMLFLR